MRYTLDIPNYLPARLNDLMRVHWRLKHALKTADLEIVATYARLQAIPLATGVRQVDYEFTLAPRGRIGDEGNWFKSLEDALVRAGMLRDDSPRWYRRGSVAFHRGKERRTVLTFTELEE